MNYDLLYLIQQSKFYVESPQLNESALTTETDSSLPIKQWYRQIDLSQKYIQNLMVKSYKEYLGKTTTETMTSGTNSYDLPNRAIQVRLIERTDTSPDQKMNPIILTDKYRYEDTTSVYPYNQVNWYTIWGNNIYVTPATSGTATIWYIKRMADLIYGTASSVTDSTIVFPTTPTFGDLSNEDDYYNDSRLKVVSATTGAGQIVTITDYNASTRTASVSWNSTPTGTVVFSLLSEIPEDYVELLLMRTALTMTVKDKDSEAYQAIASKYNELEKDMIDGLSRLVQESESINYIDDPYYD